MVDSKNLKLLVVEDDLEDEHLLCEALAEVEETRRWCTWHAAEVVQVDQLADALDCLRLQRFDAVLLNLSLPDSPALLDTFRQVNEYAHDIPVIVLADEEDENLANLVLREGAEDVLLKRELECAALARSVRYGIERRRRNGAGHFCALTAGILDRDGFGLIARHAAQFTPSANLAILEIRDLPAATSDDREARELLLVRAADLLQGAMPAPAVIGHIDKCRFGLIVIGASEDATAPVARAAREIEDALRRLVTASVSFSMVPLNSAETVDTQLSSLRYAAQSRYDAKTAMLAD